MKKNLSDKQRLDQKFPKYKPIQNSYLQECCFPIFLHKNRTIHSSQSVIVNKTFFYKRSYCMYILYIFAQFMYECFRFPQSVEKILIPKLILKPLTP